MSRRSNRPRRTASHRQIRVLRLLGWRYSTTREAYVHRVRGGRRGPVFAVPQAGTDAPAPHDDHITDAIRAALGTSRDLALSGAAAPSGHAAPKAEADPVPAPASTASAPRAADDPPPLAQRTPRPAVATPSPAPVEVHLGGELRTVRVDGRPPRAPGRPHLAIAAADETSAGQAEASA